jgi:hypothetical protein
VRTGVRLMPDYLKMLRLVVIAVLTFGGCRACMFHLFFEGVSCINIRVVNNALWIRYASCSVSRTMTNAFSLISTALPFASAFSRISSI